MFALRKFPAAVRNAPRCSFCTEQTVMGLLPVTPTLDIVDTQKADKIPMFRIKDAAGKTLPGAVAPVFDKETATKMYCTMNRIQALDDVFYNAQRQGRVSFYMQNIGEEALQIGSASALKPQDVVFTQYREVGILLWRGFTVQQCADQCFSNEKDLGKGRQMPIHYGSAELNFQTVSSPLTTQLPQAVGAAYALKQSDPDAIAVCYFGEGAASEGDFHAALNFSATLEAPIVFVCRNNGYAISTPIKDQFRGDGIASRAAGYGMHVIRVDGNDFFAMHAAVAAARTLALEQNRPVLIEAMTYRGGHHSTSDDSTRYRETSEIDMWLSQYDPMVRFRAYMKEEHGWTEEQETAVKAEERAAVMLALETAEQRPKPHVRELFNDVYETMPSHLLKQQQELEDQIAKYPEHYSAGH